MDTGASHARGESWGGGNNVGTAWFRAPTADMKRQGWDTPLPVLAWAGSE